MHMQPVEYSDQPELQIMVTGTHLTGGTNAENTLDDVFGSSAPGAGASLGVLSGPEPQPSDLPRLQREHSTAGYRDGIAAGKAQSIQAGFDEGYSLGAEIGKTVGFLLGFLEAIAEALGGRDDPDAVEIARLAQSAKNELSCESIFSPDYWLPDGTWKYQVIPREKSAEQQIVFADVAASHPLALKWTAVVIRLKEEWGVDDAMFTLNGASEAAPGDGTEGMQGSSRQGERRKNAVVTRQALDW